MGDMQIVVASKNVVEPQFVELMVPLYSYGCEKKVKKALAYLKGIYSVNVDFDQQKVTVWGICNKFDVLDTIRSKRKGARFWNAEDNVDQDNLLQPSSEQVNNNSSSPPLSGQTKRSSSAPPLALIRTRSLSWKAFKKAFVRSYSFS